jgi:hypothetical protein
MSLFSNVYTRISGRLNVDKMTENDYVLHMTPPDNPLQGLDLRPRRG